MPLILGVAVEDGIVTLAGHVPTYAQKDVAEQAASRGRGVKGIAQRSVVRPAETGQTADDQIAATSSTPGSASICLR